MSGISEEFPVSLDARGFVRFPLATVEALKLNQYRFAEISVDPVGRRIALKLSGKERVGSFRVLCYTDRYVLYVRGAMNAAGMPQYTGPAVLRRSGQMFLLELPKPVKRTGLGEWVYFPCRNSASIPMASLDHRGTLILDRNCTKSLDPSALFTADAHYDAKKKIFRLIFHKSKGTLNVRQVGTHANLSFMGTLSSYGISLPRARIRMACRIEGKKALSFSVADLIRSTR